MRRLSRQFTCVLFFLSGISLSSSLRAQDASASADWEALPAAEFAAAAKEMFAAEPPASVEKQQLAADFAWTRFFADESFVTNGDWDALVALTDLFAPRRNLLVGDDATAQQVDARFATLHSQIAARLLAHPELATRIGLYQLDKLTKTLTTVGYSPEEKAELFVAWMTSNEWRQLPLNDLYNLYSWINVDAVDRCHFSARWTGSITAPATGAYTLRQVPQYSGTDSRLVVSLNDQVVLDSTDKARGPSRFQSEPVQMQAGQAMPLKVDMVHDVSRIDWSEGAPMVVLTWESEGRRPQIISSSAFTPPNGFAAPGAHGLRGEFFRNMEFGDSQVVRLDPALDLVSSWPPAAPIHHEAASAVLAACTAKVLGNNYLANAAAEGDAELFSYSLWRIAYRMTATRRVELVETLTATPEALAIMTPEAMGRLVQAVYMLPGDEQLTLFGEWASARPQPRCEAGEFPGWAVGSYQYNNLDFYWLMGLFWQRTYWEDAEKLWDEYLVRPDGECNLAVAYATAFAAQRNNKGDLLLARLKEHIDDDALNGDQRATWYIARAYAKGALMAKPEPMAGYDDLQGALVSAESDDYGYWALQEMVARLNSCDHGEHAKLLMEQHRGRFVAPEQQASMAKWTADADRLAANYAERRQAEADQALADYAKELQSRRAKASQAGDEAAAKRLDELIADAEANTAAEQ